MIIVFASSFPSLGTTKHAIDTQKLNSKDFLGHTHLEGAVKKEIVTIYKKKRGNQGYIVQGKKISAVKMYERKHEDNLKYKWKNWWTQQQLAAATQKETLSATC